MILFTGWNPKEYEVPAAEPSISANSIIFCLQAASMSVKLTLNFVRRKLGFRNMHWNEMKCNPSPKKSDEGLRQRQFCYAIVHLFIILIDFHKKQNREQKQNSERSIPMWTITIFNVVWSGGNPGTAHFPSHESREN